ncbi:MAG: FAD-binding oxidoreductase, partial [Actinomycetota bacterium]
MTTTAATARTHTGADLDAVAVALRSALRPDQVRTGASETRLYRHDASNMANAAAIVTFPESAADVQATVQVADRFGVPFVPRGSGTGLSGGAVPPDGAIVISTSKMNRILSVDAPNRQAWVEP